MISFEVHINGKKVCTAGVGENGVLSAVVTFVKRAKDASMPERDPKPPIDLKVGGLANRRHMRWLEPSAPIDVGDEIAIRVRETDVVDEPSETYSAQDPEIARKNRRYFYECYKQEFEHESGGEMPDAETAKQLRRVLYEQYRKEFESER
jgi:hypothetical protein